jgi:glutathione peroxidase
MRPGRRVVRTLLASATLAVVAAIASGCATTESSTAPASGPAGTASPAASPQPATDAPTAAAQPEAPSIYGFSMKRLDGTETSLSAWSGKVLLVVNTASKCGYTPQYEGLQALHAKYSARGFAVLGFPSNDFGGQEPGTSKEIATFCTSIYAVNFPMFEKVSTTGSERAPLYALLSAALGEPHWNFHKYLIDKQGRPVRAWESKVEPQAPELEAAIEAQLAAPEGTAQR